MLQLLADLSKAQRRKLEDLMNRVEYESGDTLFEQGGPALGVHFIREGEIEVSRRTVDGKKMTFQLMGPGDVLGISHLFSQENYISYGKAVEDSVIGFIEKGNFFRLIKEDADLAFGVCKWLSTELLAFQLKLVEASYRGSKHRICRMLAQSNGTYNISRERLAQLTGVSYKTVIQVIKELESRGYISANRKNIDVREKEELEKISISFPVSNSGNSLL